MDNTIVDGLAYIGEGFLIIVLISISIFLYSYFSDLKYVNIKKSEIPFICFDELFDKKPLDINIFMQSQDDVFFKTFYNLLVKLLNDNCNISIFISDISNINSTDKILELNKFDNFNINVVDYNFERNVLFSNTQDFVCYEKNESIENKTLYISQYKTCKNKNSLLEINDIIKDFNIIEQI